MAPSGTSNTEMDRRTIAAGGMVVNRLRLSAEEAEIVRQAMAETGRPATEVVREAIRATGARREGEK